MSKLDPGYEPVFPTGEGVDYVFHGLTKRELFAALIMPKVVPYFNPTDAAREAVQLADLLIAELSKGPSNAEIQDKGEST